MTIDSLNDTTVPSGLTPVDVLMNHGMAQPDAEQFAAALDKKPPQYALHCLDIACASLYARGLAPVTVEDQSSEQLSN